jgi:hypothetical protein
MKSALFLLLITAYVLVKRISEKRTARTRSISEEEGLLHLARLNGCSEYELFRKAAVFWNVPDRQVEADFRTYLLEDLLPHYVRDYVRKNPIDRDQLQQLIHNSGGIFYPSWKA